MNEKKRMYNEINHSVSVVISTIILVVLFLVPTHSAHAVLSGCAASVSPSSATQGTTTSFVFTVTNDDGASNAIWVHMSPPDLDAYPITSGSGPGWTSSNSGTEIEFTGG